jgi:hypothetical protein
MLKIIRKLNFSNPQILFIMWKIFLGKWKLNKDKKMH